MSESLDRFVARLAARRVRVDLDRPEDGVYLTDNPKIRRGREDVDQARRWSADVRRARRWRHLASADLDFGPTGSLTRRLLRLTTTRDVAGVRHEIDRVEQRLHDYRDPDGAGRVGAPEAGQHGSGDMAEIAPRAAPLSLLAHEADLRRLLEQLAAGTAC